MLVTTCNVVICLLCFSSLVVYVLYHVVGHEWETDFQNREAEIAQLVEDSSTVNQVEKQIHFLLLTFYYFFTTP